jgi:cysteine desulfurase
MRIYLDNNATTSVDPAVVEVMTSCLKQIIGNPSSVHYFGQEAYHQLAHARRSLALVLGVRPSEVFFTSGGTEGINLLIQGILRHAGEGHVITSDLEHSAVLETVRALEKEGYEASVLSPGEWGAVSADAVRAAIRPDTKLIVLMAANNETGVKTDVEAIAELADQRGIPFVLDCVGLFGKEPLTLPKGVTGAVFSGHKFHAAKGAGMIYVKQGTKLKPLMYGGGHEASKRPGTENLVGIVGLAKAAELAADQAEAAMQRMQTQRARFESALSDALGDVQVNGSGPRVSNTSNLYFPRVDGESLLMTLDLEGLAASHGSACAAGALQPSRVLLNMGYGHERARSSLRFSLCRESTDEEVERAIAIITKTVQRLRKPASS